jgi:hypothetical protein
VFEATQRFDGIAILNNIQQSNLPIQIPPFPGRTPDDNTTWQCPGRPEREIQEVSSVYFMNATISFTSDGTAHCLWTDAISLHDLGRLEITRASQIEFNDATQQWEVIDRRGRVRFFAKSRAACLEWEHENLQPE